MTKPTISNINEELDVKLFMFIVKQHIGWMVVFFLVSFVCAFLYLRYTHPIYESRAVIQVESNDEVNKLFEQEVSNDEILKKVELIRSPLFIQRCIEKLPVKVSYYRKGAIKDMELFMTSPFEVYNFGISTYIYDVPISIKFLSKSKIELSYPVAGTRFYKQYNINDDIKFDGRMRLKILDYNQLFNQSSDDFDENNYYIVFHNPANILSSYMSNLSVDILNPAARTIFISMKNTNAKKSAVFVNTITEEFKIYDVEKKEESVNKTLSFIDEQLKMVYDKLFVSEMELDSFKKRHKIIDTTQERTALPSYYSRINDLENQMVRLELEENMMNEINKRINEKNIDIYQLFMLLSGSEFKGAISTLLDNLQKLLMSREELLYQVTRNSGQIEALDYRIGIQKKILIESLGTLKQNIAVRRKDLTNKIQSYTKVDIGAPGSYNSLEYARLQRLNSINEKFYNELITKKAEFSIDKAGYVTNTVILENAQTPEYPISPIKSTVFLFALAIAFIVSVILIGVKYLFYNEISTPSDIEKYTDKPVIGIIPKYRLDIPTSQLIVDKRPRSIIAESLRVIRTNLQFISNTPGPKLLAVTSTISGEGKTFFAINLAGVIAFSKKKVIVVDSDMRKPKIHLGFGVENINGLSTILVNKHTVEECVNHSVLDNLDFITAGPIPPNPSELILSSRMDELIDYLKTKYDFVIIDNPPIGLVTDGMKSLSKADYPVYVMRANHSKRQFINNIDRLADVSSIKNLSVVLNAVEPNNAGYSSYGGYRKKGYGYGGYGNYGYTYGSYGYGYGYGYGNEKEVEEEMKYYSFSYKWKERVNKFVGKFKS